ncbi:hypothetical protein GWK47_043677 [Chionoecetes opilio]|uniref:Uncharacterized protein n=1 Tax=Chionoecetes opilio TaxID=41210 RepID=A0A8J4YA47_CHIOP|nr:hypothetical protein GWK47_043677 [Chionoecetes opilio]
MPLWGFTTASNSGVKSGSAKLWSNSLQEGVLPGLQTPHSRSAGWGLYGEFWARFEPRNLGSSTSKTFGADLTTDNPTTLPSDKMVEKKEKRCKEIHRNPRSENLLERYREWWVTLISLETPPRESLDVPEPSSGQGVARNRF